MKKLFLSLISLIAFLFFLSISINYLFNENIGAITLNNIKGQLTVDCSADNIRLNILKSFPYISIELKKFKLDEKSGFDNDTLLFAEKILIEFNLLQFMRKDFRLKRIIIKDGKLNIKYLNKSGNYNVFNSTGESNINLDDLKFYNTVIEYTDSNTNIVTQAEQLSINLLQSEKNKKLLAKGRVIMDSLIVTKRNYVNQKKIRLNLSLILMKDKIKINPSVLEIEDLYKNIEGEISNRNNISLSIKGENQKINSIIYCTPDYLQKIYTSFEADGIINYTAKIKGIINKNTHPSFDMNFKIENGSLKTKTNFEFKDGVVKGSINNGEIQNLSSTEINISEFSAKAKNSTLNGAFSIYNLNDPLLKTSSFISTWNLGEVNKYFNKSPFKNLSGKLFVTTDYSGKIAFNPKFKTHFLNASHTSIMDFSNVTFLYQDSTLPFIIRDAKAKIINSISYISLLDFTIGDSDFSFKGEIKDLPQFIIDNSQNILEINGDLNSTYIKFDELIAKRNAEKNKKLTSIFPNWCKFNLNLDIENFSQKDIHLSSLQGKINYKNLFFSFDSIQANIFNGLLKFSGKFYEYNTDHISLLSNMQVENINIRNLFSVFSNFGQSFIQDHHLKGLVSGNLVLHTNWEPDFKFNPSSLEVSANYIIEKGELIEFAPLNKLSSYVHVEDLKNVKFSRLENTLEIKNELITIPKMNINSSALTVSLSGTHKFNNEIDYQIQLLLSELLSNEFRKKNTDIEHSIEKNKDGLSKVYLKMTGNTNDPKIYFDKIYVKEQLKEKLNKEKETIKEIIKEDILNNRSETKTPNQEDLIIEWEDEILK